MGREFFQDRSKHAGSAFRFAYLARGLAAGDFDNDGGLDIVFTRLDDQPVLLRNGVGSDHPWVGFKLQGTKSNRDAIGAKITLDTGKRKLIRWITGGASYLSSHDRRVIVGLGDGFVAGTVDAEIR